MTCLCQPFNLRYVRGSVQGYIGQMAVGIGLPDGSRMFVFGGQTIKGKNYDAVNTAYEYIAGKGPEGEWRRLDDLKIPLRGPCAFYI